MYIGTYELLNYFYLEFQETVVKDIVSLKEDVALILQRSNTQEVSVQLVEGEFDCLRSLNLPSSTPSALTALNTWLSAESNQVTFVSGIRLKLIIFLDRYEELDIDSCFYVILVHNT
jgi:hypothetical protein